MFGLGKCLTFGAILQFIGYSVFIAPPPFPTFPPVYVFVGMGVAWQGEFATAALLLTKPQKSNVASI